MRSIKKISFLFILVFQFFVCPISGQKKDGLYRVISHVTFKHKFFSVADYFLVEHNDTISWIYSIRPCNNKKYEEIVVGKEYHLKLELSRYQGKFQKLKKHDSIITQMYPKYIVDEKIWYSSDICGCYIQSSVIDDKPINTTRIHNTGRFHVDIICDYPTIQTTEVDKIYSPNYKIIIRPGKSRESKNKFFLRAIGCIATRLADGEIGDSILSDCFVGFVAPILILQKNDSLFMFVPTSFTSNKVKRLMKKIERENEFNVKLSVRDDREYPFDYQITDLMEIGPDDKCSTKIYDVKMSKKQKRKYNRLPPYYITYNVYRQIDRDTGHFIYEFRPTGF